MSNNPMKRQRSPKHLSQLKPTERARADQLLQFALLAIVAQQKRVVAIPYEEAERIFETHRLKIALHEGKIVLAAERMPSPIIVPEKANANGETQQ